MVGFYTGMTERQAEKATDRRKTSQLFNDYLNNARTHGLELTEEGMTDFWNQNSGNRFTRNAMPSQQRLQSLVSGQNELIAQKQSARDLQSIRDNAELDKLVSGFRDEYFDANAYVEGNNSGAMDFINQRVGDNALLKQAYGRVVGDGSALGSAHKAHQSDQFLNNYSKVSPLISDGVFDSDTISAYLPGAPKHIIKQIADKAKTDWDRKQELQGQADTDRRLDLRSSAVNRLLTMTTLKNEIDIDATLASLGVTNPEDIEVIKQNYMAQAGQQLQAQMEKKNLANLALRNEARGKIRNSTVALRKDVNEVADSYFSPFNDSVTVRSALSNIQQKYMLKAKHASDLADAVRALTAPDDNKLYGKTAGEITQELEVALKQVAPDAMTYDAYEANESFTSDSAIGFDMHTVDSYRASEINGINSELQRYIENMNQAIDLGNPKQFAKAKARLVAFSDSVMREIDYRRNNYQASFGMAADKAEVYEVLQEASDLIGSKLNESKLMQAPEFKNDPVVNQNLTTDQRIGRQMDALDEERKKLVTYSVTRGKHIISDQQKYNDLTKRINGLQEQIDNFKATE